MAERVECGDRRDGSGSLACWSSGQGPHLYNSCSFISPLSLKDIMLISQVCWAQRL